MEQNDFWIPLLLTFFAGASTGVGSFISLFIKKFKESYLTMALGFSAGVMIYISFVEMLKIAIDDAGFLEANLAFFAGILTIMSIDFLIPHEYLMEKVRVDEQNRKLVTAGIFIALGVAIHNFPEGMAVFVSALENPSLGLSLAVAIAIHNIPEGIAVAMPIYYATKSRGKAFWLSFLSGLAEPIGATVAALILLPFLTDEILSLTLAFVGGIMVFISFDELLPMVFKSEKSHLAVVGIILGMVIMAISLELF